MHYLSAWFTKNSVAANLMMILFLISGYFTLTTIRIEGFPAIPPSSVSINTIYPGASADQVDTGISRQIEKALEGMPGLKKIFSNSFEGFSNVIVEKNSSFSLDRFENEIKTRVDSIDNFPQHALRPVVSRDEFTVEALIVQIYGSSDLITLQKTARMVKTALLSDPDISKMQTFGLLPRELRIEVDKSKLRAHGLSLADVSAAINASSFVSTAGLLKSESGRLLVRTDARAFHLKEFKQLPVISNTDGIVLKVGDIAKVIEGFEDQESFARFQGEPCVGILVSTSYKGDLIEVSHAAHKIIDKISKNLPGNVKVDIWGESSVYMQERLDLLKKNAFQGLAIVFILLAIFLNIRLAFWVAMGIPISIGGAMALMGSKIFDYSLNDITTFGLIIVMGILVDDAVVVGESVYEERTKTDDPVQGTIAGVKKVSTATVFGAFTTIAAFYPSLLIDNELGKVFASFSMVVIICLLVSLIESKLILPAHLAGINFETKDAKNIFSRVFKTIQNKAGSGLEYFNYSLYKPFLKHAMGHRYSFCLILTAISTIIAGFIYNKQIRVVFFPEIPGQIITVNMEMIKGSPMNLTLENLNKIEQAAFELNNEIMQKFGTKDPPVEKILSALDDKHIVSIYAQLQPEKTRKIKTIETIEQWRKKVIDLEGVQKLHFSGSFETAGGFELEVRNHDNTLLLPAVTQLVAQLKKIKGVHDVYGNLNHGTPQIQIKLKPLGHNLGLTGLDLAEQIGNGFGGLEIQRFLKNGDEVKVVLKYKAVQRQFTSDLLDTKIKTPKGDLLPLPMIASIETEYAPTNIFRKNNSMVAIIKASLQEEIISSEELFDLIKKKIVPGLVSQYPDLEISGAGELEEIGEMKKELKKALVIIVVGIYALIAIPLKSYIQPLIIMSVIPFAFVGAILGHKITGFPLSILSILGMLGASGVVVNDSLVMLTRYNDMISQGHAFAKAAILAGSSRFRAVFLTTATTSCALMPLIFETSEQAQYLIPAAVSLAFGELFATPVTLVLIPVLLSIGQDIKKIFSFRKLIFD